MFCRSSHFKTTRTSQTCGLTPQPSLQTNKCLGNKWNTLKPAKVPGLNAILAALPRWTLERTTATSPSAPRRPQAACSPGNWCLLPTVVNHRGLWTRPPRQTAKLARKTQTKVRTVRHNRAAQAEITTPYPGPRFPRAATVAHCSGRKRQERKRRGRSSAEEGHPEETQSSQHERLWVNSFHKPGTARVRTPQEPCVKPQTSPQHS